jgi:hypothetical protein
MPAVNMVGKHQDIRHRKPSGGLLRGQHQQCDLTGGIEPQAKQKANGNHMPRPADEALHRTQNAAHHTTGRRNFERATAPCAPQPRQGEQIGHADHQQEPGGEQCTPGVRRLPQTSNPVHGGKRDDAQTQDQDGRGMPQSEEESAVPGTAPVMHQFAHHVVDRGDVIGIDRVTQAEYPCQQRGTQKRRAGVKRVAGPSSDQDIGEAEQGHHGGDLVARGLGDHVSGRSRYTVVPSPSLLRRRGESMCDGRGVTVGV